MGERMHNTLHFIFGKRYLIYSSCIEGVIVPQPIIKIVFGMAVNKVKEGCEGAT
jgi:hypothetical protein